MLPPTELYLSSTITNFGSGRYGVRKAIEKLKDEISIEGYLRAHGVEARQNRARCIVHGGDNPTSFSIDPERQRWHCFSCGARGDVFDLYLAVEGGQFWEAVVDLSQRFGIALPEKPERWRQWQDEKQIRRDMIRRALVAGYQRRLFRIFGAYLSDIVDPAEREAEAQRFWDDLHPVALRCAIDRMGQQ